MLERRYQLSTNLTSIIKFLQKEGKNERYIYIRN